MDPKIIMNTVTEILIKTKGAKLKSIQEKISGLQKLVLENNAMAITTRIFLEIEQSSLMEEIKVLKEMQL